MVVKSVPCRAVSAQATAPPEGKTAAATPMRLKRHDLGNNSPTARSACEGGCTVATAATGAGSADSSEAKKVTAGPLTLARPAPAAATYARHARERSRSTVTFRVPQ